MAAAKSFDALTKDRQAMDSTPFSLAQPFRTVAGRCHRRFADYQRLRETLDGRNPRMSFGVRRVPAVFFPYYGETAASLSPVALFACLYQAALRAEKSNCVLSRTS
jgi:hypothetical protein